MQRKDFLKRSLAGALGLTGLGALAGSEVRSTYDRLMEQVGFNHLPNQEQKTMKTILHRAHTRGLANHGWLESRHSFSFANYYNPERMNFGVLRVLNDDVVAPGRGFGAHPHDNMEIISIPLAGDLQHQDNMGNTTVIRQGDIQVMSAGTGVIHSEYNKNQDQEVKFLQIWLFPNRRNVTPRYDQLAIDTQAMHNNLQQILSPSPDDAGVWIHQDAWFHLGRFDAGHQQTYTLHKPGNGLYAFVLSGDITVAGQDLHARDGFGIWDVDQLDLRADSEAEILLMEVPMAI